MKIKGLRGIRCQYGLNQRGMYPVYCASGLFLEEDMQDSLLRIIGVAPEQRQLNFGAARWLHHA